jgi:hypothetical protein
MGFSSERKHRVGVSGILGSIFIFNDELLSINIHFVSHFLFAVTMQFLLVD